MRRLQGGGQSARPWLIPGVALAVLAAPAFAQEAQELETIIVTATRRDESLQTVAASVSAVSGSFIDDIGARNIREVMGMVPGLAIVTTGDTKYILRGVSTDTWEEQRPATAEYLDETPITSPGSIIWALDSTPYLIDMDRVEVLRGPQGTLFGSSSMGGTVRYITRRPTMNRAESWVQLGAATTTHGEPGYSASGMFNAPLQEGVLALRGVGYYDVLGGFIDNHGNGVNDINESQFSGGRLALEWHPNDRIAAIARVSLQRQDDGGSTQRDLADPPNSQTRMTDESSTARRIVSNVDVSYVTAAVTLRSITSWATTDITNRTDGTQLLFSIEGLQNPLSLVNGQDTDDFIQEFRVESDDSKTFDWLAGVFYQHRDNVYTQSFPSPGYDELSGGAAAAFGHPDNLYVLDLAQPVEELAGYGEVGWRPAERWRLSAGARWFRFERSEHEQADGVWNGGPTDRTGKATESSVSPRYTISYKPDDDRTYYAVASNGYRPGGPNLGEPGGIDCSADLAAHGYDSAPLNFKSDELWNYEIGARQAWPEQRLSLAGALYRIDWSRMQNPVFLDCAWGFVQNAGKARNDGVELEVAYALTSDIDFRLSGSYVDARLEHPGPGVPGLQGDRLPGVPDFSGAVSARWLLFRGESFAASVYGMWTYVGDRYSGYYDSGTDSRLLMTAYDILDLRLQLDSEHWNAALIADNLLDEDGVVAVYGEPSTRYQVPVRPRTLRLTLQYRF
jgi:outer membrane receptor protein involved in Fe transport